MNMKGMQANVSDRIQAVEVGLKLSETSWAGSFDGESTELCALPACSFHQQGNFDLISF